MSGRITEAELRPLVEKAFGDWQRGAPAMIARRRAAEHGGEDRDGGQARRAAVAVAGRRRLAAPRATPDYEAMRLANDTFGGLFSSRINLNLREAHGYTYGANSQFVFRRTPGVLRRVHRRAHRRDSAGPVGSLRRN